MKNSGKEKQKKSKVLSYLQRQGSSGIGGGVRPNDTSAKEAFLREMVGISSRETPTTCEEARQSVKRVELDARKPISLKRVIGTFGAGRESCPDATEGARGGTRSAC